METNLTDESISARFSGMLREHHGISAGRVAEREGGWSARAFRVDAGGRAFFLKAYDKRRASTKTLTAAIDAYMPVVLWLDGNTALKGKIVCPVLTNSGACKFEDADFVCILFPHIEGETVRGNPLSAAQAAEIAGIIAELHRHGAEIPVPTGAIRESFAVPFCAALKEMIPAGHGAREDEPLAILKKRESALLRAIGKTEALAGKLRNDNLPFVLCHTDAHGWNMMQSDRLVLLDWEGLKLAPREADLFAFAGNLFWHDCADEFFRVYGKTHAGCEIDPDALAFYQTRRRLEDIFEFAQSLLRDGIAGGERERALSHLRRECALLP